VRRSDAVNMCINCSFFTLVGNHCEPLLTQFSKRVFNVISPNSTCCVTSRHLTTRYLAHTFSYKRKSYVMCRACFTASATQHVATSAPCATRPSRLARQARQTRQDERDRSDTQLSLFVMCETWYRFIHKHYCYFVVCHIGKAWRSMHDTTRLDTSHRDTHDTSCLSCRDVSWRDEAKWNLG